MTFRGLSRRSRDPVVVTRRSRVAALLACSVALWPCVDGGLASIAAAAYSLAPPPGAACSRLSPASCAVSFAGKEPVGHDHRDTFIDTVRSAQPPRHHSSATSVLVVIACLALIALLSAGRGRWYRYAQAAGLTALCGWVIGGGAGLGLALASLSVALFLVEGWMRSRPPSRPRLMAPGSLYRKRLLETRAATNIVPRRHASADDRLPYFELQCTNREGDILPSALNEMLAWASSRKTGLMALYGGFGTGKSTTCLEFCLTLLERDPHALPIYLPLNGVPGDSDAASWLAKIIGEQYGVLNHPGDPTFALTHDHHVCLVLDGLESIEDYFVHPVVRSLLDGTATHEPRVLLAARRLAAELPASEQARALPSNPQVSEWLGLVPMDADSQHRYAATVHASRSRVLPDEGPPIASRFDTLDRPFLIDLAYCATGSGTPVGSRLATLYAAATDSVLAADAEEKPLAPPTASLKTILTAFALEAYRLGEEQLPLDVAVQYIAAGTGLPQTEAINALNSCRLLTDYGGRIGFAHRSLEEFFVAAACMEQIRLGQWGALTEFLVVEPVLSFLLDLLAMAPERDRVEKQISRRFTDAMALQAADSSGHLAANLGSLMSGLSLSMCGAQLKQVSLSGATLRNADLRKAHLEDVDLSGVDLSGAKLGDAVLQRVDFRNAFIRSVDSQGATFIDCDFWNLRWVEEPPSLWAARWHRRERTVVCGVSTGHIMLVALTLTGEIGKVDAYALGATGVLDVDTDDSGTVVLASDRAGGVVELSSSPRGEHLSAVTSDDTTHAANVRRIRFAPDGPAWYATASRDGFVRLFVRHASVPYRQHGRHRAPVMDLAWHPRGSLLASVGYDGKVFVWDLTADYAQPHAAPTSSNAPGIMRAVAFSPSGQRIVAGGETGVVTEWQVDRQGVASNPTIVCRSDSAIFALAYLSESTVLAGTWAGDVLLIRAGEVKPVWTHGDTVRSIDIAHDCVMTASWDGGIAIATLIPELISGPLMLPFPEIPDEAASNFAGARMVRPTNLSARYIQHFEHLGVAVRQ
jgi:WD40 repeat protein